MSPLLFANWRRINKLFCAVMWLVAIILGLIILAETTSAKLPIPAVHQMPRAVFLHRQ